MSQPFEFNLGDDVIVKSVNAEAVVNGRAEFVRGQNAYLVQYESTDLATAEVWVRAAGLSPKPSA